jgi:hypothetical protein
MRRLWRQDQIRRRRPIQLEELKRALILDQVTLWLAWDDAPPDRGEWGGPHYLLGMVITCPLDRVLSVQFAAGRSLKRWTQLMADALSAYAGIQSLRQLRVYCRKGWLQELGPCWPSLGEAGIVTFHRDPDRLHLDVKQAACA